MKRISIKPLVAVAGFAALLGGCATTLETGPGYYRYDTHIAGARSPRVVYTEPAVTYRERSVYREPIVVYREPAYRTAYRYNAYNDHGQ